MEADRVVVYKRVGEVELKLHVMLPDGWAVEDRRSAVVFFFGGGWMGGTVTQFFPHCRHLAERGMVAISAEYRVQTIHGTTPDACVRDGKSALRFIRAHAAEWGIDPQRIAAGGGSAGGHVATTTAVLDGFDEASDDLAVDPRPNALVLFNPVIDNGPEGYGHERVSGYWEAFSPLHNLRPGVPPTVVMLGTADNLIPVATMCRFQAAIEAVGGRCDLHLYGGQPHGFFNAREGNPYYPQTVAAMDAFLASIGYVAG